MTTQASPVETAAVTTQPPLVEAKDVVKQYGPTGKGLFSRGTAIPPALGGVSLSVCPGESLAVIGESGSGKSTLGRILLSLTTATSGSVHFDGQDMLAMKGEELRRLRRRMNYVFQNPFAAVNRRHTIKQILSAPMDAQGMYRGAERGPRCEELLDMVHLLPSHLDRFPHELSGGQLQRVVIARALATNPDFLVADEPTTGLDVITSARLVNLLNRLKDQLGLSLMFISHDLRTVASIADRIVVMRKGEIVESGASHDVLTNPQHEYTAKLIDSIPHLPKAAGNVQGPSGTPSA